MLIFKTSQLSLKSVTKMSENLLSIINITGLASCVDKGFLSYLNYLISITFSQFYLNTYYVYSILTILTK